MLNGIAVLSQLCISSQWQRPQLRPSSANVGSGRRRTTSAESDLVLASYYLCDPIQPQAHPQAHERLNERSCPVEIISEIIEDETAALQHISTAVTPFPFWK